MAKFDAFETVYQHILSGNNVLIIGEGGTGKTFMLKKLIKILDAEDISAVMTASTGVAASNVGGKTFHSFSGIGLGEGERDSLLKKVLGRKKIVEDIITTRVLFIDEISMLGVSIFDKVDYIFRKVRKFNEPFGGMQLVLCGDFLQLPPVNDNFIFNWEKFGQLKLKTVNLTEKKRYDDEEWSSLLSRARVGKLSQQDSRILKDKCEESARINFSTFEIRPTILYCKKVDVDYENKTELKKIDDDKYTFYATDTHTGMNQLQINFLFTQLDQLIPKKISLKKGAQVMLRYNMDVKSGLVNGARGVVLEINEKSEMVTVKFHNGIIVPIGQHVWDIKDKKAKVKVSREQIPLILAYSITIHKCQGLTLDLAICNLKDVFEYGQAYVALSRVRNLKGLYLTGLTKDSIKAHPQALEFMEKIVNTN